MRFIKAEFDDLGLHNGAGEPDMLGSYRAFRLTERGDTHDEEPQSLTFLVPEHQLPGPNRTVAPYRLVRSGEKVLRGDQILLDDCETWGDLTGWEIGLEYSPSIFVPLRRRTCDTKEAQSDE